MFSRWLPLVFCAALLLNTHALASQQWDSLRSDHFEVFFPGRLRILASEVLDELERHRNYGSKLAGKLSGRFPIVIEDLGNTSNGFARPFERKILLYHMPPDSSGHVAQYTSWMRHLSFHEYVHYAQFTNTSGISSLLSENLSTVFSPNLYSPGWLFEGLAVYAESTVSPGEGRLNDGYYSAVVAARASEGKLPSYAAATATPFDYPLGAHYIYGSGFVRYLAERYGPEKFGKFCNEYGSYFWVPLTGGIIPELGLDKAARKVYGSPFSDLYNEWVAHVTAESKAWHNDGTAVTSSGWTKKFLTAHRGKLYYYRQHFYRTAPFSVGSEQEIAVCDPATGREETVRTLLSAVTAPLCIRDNMMYYAVSDIRPGYQNYSLQGYGLYTRIMAYDLGSGTERHVLNGDISAFTVLPDATILYTVRGSEPEMSEVRTYRDGKETSLGVIDYQVSELLFANGTIIAIGKKNDSTWDILTIDVSNPNCKKLVATPYSEIQTAIEGDILYFSGNPDGIYGIYAYSITDGSIHQLTHSGYAVNPVPLNESLYFIGLTAEGSDIFVNRMPESTEAVAYGDHQPDRVQQVTEQQIMTGSVKYLQSNQYSYLLRPYSTVFPDLLAGEDALGKNSYRLSYSAFGSIDMTLTSRELSPLEISLASLDRDSRRKTYMSASYPLYRSLTSGLYSLDASLTTDLQGEHMPQLLGTVTLPQQTLLLAARTDLGSHGFALDAAHQYRFADGSLTTKIGGFHRFDRVQAFHGYTPQLLEEITGMSAGAEVTWRLLSIRNGLLNPFVYFSDLYGSLFADYLYSSERGWSVAGAELSVETQLGYLLRCVPGIGISISENDQRVFWSLGMVY